MPNELDTCKTRDGRAWGDVRVYELDGMIRDAAMAAKVVFAKRGFSERTIRALIDGTIAAPGAPAIHERARDQIDCRHRQSLRGGNFCLSGAVSPMTKTRKRQ